MRFSRNGKIIHIHRDELSPVPERYTSYLEGKYESYCGTYSLWVYKNSDKDYPKEISYLEVGAVCSHCVRSLVSRDLELQIKEKDLQDRVNEDLRELFEK